MNSFQEERQVAEDVIRVALQNLNDKYGFIPCSVDFDVMPTPTLKDKRSSQVINVKITVIL